MSKTILEAIYKHYDNCWDKRPNVFFIAEKENVYYVFLIPNYRDALMGNFIETKEGYTVTELTPSCGIFELNEGFNISVRMAKTKVYDIRTAFNLLKNYDKELADIILSKNRKVNEEFFDYYIKISTAARFISDDVKYIADDMYDDIAEKMILYMFYET